MTGYSGIAGKLLCTVLLTLLAVSTSACSMSGQAVVDKEKVGKQEKAVPEELSSLDVVRLSERTTVDAGSAHFAMNMTFPASEGMPEFSMDMRGVQDFESGDGDFDMTMPMMPMNGGIENRLVDGVMYQRYPREMRAGMGFMPPGKVWISTDLDEQYKEQSGMSLSDVENAAAETPADQLDYLRSVGSVEKVGSERLDDVQTEHYRAVVDLDRELKSLEGSREVTRAYRDLEEQLGTDEFPLDVWLDKQGRVRKQVMVIPLPDSAPVEGINGETTEQPLPKGEMNMTITYSDFGVPVEVDAPSPATVMSQDEFMALMRGAGAT